ncbi:hypothetical protein [Arthrobacter sp. Y81]|uniref:hypothetical protein n=1 Tax=Arthrobacter sp. Y81 TaxID=2058897 RepID=UPI0011AFD771|nr:hypothetical protein [Arthrobacter sp. Y81]
MMSVIGPWVAAGPRAGLEEAAVVCSSGLCLDAASGSAQEAAAIRTAPAKMVPTILFIDSPKSWAAP